LWVKEWLATFNFITNKTNKMMMQHTLGADSQTPGYSHEMGTYRDQTRYAAQRDDATLQDFFERPIKVAEYRWGTSTALFEQFDPWTLFFENPRVINRIANYNLLRADLRVKFLVTGNGFFYGRVLASYNPLHTVDNFAVSRALISQDAIQESQRPHLYLDPTTNQGGEIKCPFFWEYDALEVPTSQWRQMGQVTLRSLGDLKHANGATDQVTISVIVYAENVELSMPTSTEPGSLVPQMGEDPIVPQMADEYGSTPISTPASAVARVAGRLTDVPYIGLYARATELAASGVASIAKLFGYSRPAIIEDIQKYVPRYCGELATTNVGDACHKLTVDAKQELTIDSRVTGLDGKEELMICDLAARESYLTFFPWTIAAAPETTIWSSRVTPLLWDNDPGGAIAMTPSALAVLPFAFWRCKVRFRFQIVASQYHKGRLRIVWDPYGFATNEYNVNYNHIVDIADEKDFTIEIGWGAPEHFSQTGVWFSSLLPFSTGLIGDAGNSSANGVIRVLVMNELTSPNSDVNNDVRVNVITSVHDLEVASPDSFNVQSYEWFDNTPPAEGAVQPQGEDPSSVTDYVDSLSAIVPQMADEQGDMEDTTEPSKPQHDNALRTMGTEIDTSDPTYHVFFGEQITSFRQMMKRYNYANCYIIDVPTEMFINSNIAPALPLYRGYAPDAIHPSSGFANFNFVPMTLINWLMPCFAGWRGSLRWKAMFLWQGRPLDHALPLMSVTRLRAVNGYVNNNLIIPQNASDSLTNEIYTIEFNDTHNGHAATPALQNPILEFEVPFYSTRRFGNARDATLITGSTNAGASVKLSTATFSGANTGEQAVMRKYVAIGEDFNFHFFKGIPYLYTGAAPDPT
jgi:hypothetical protein